MSVTILDGDIFQDDAIYIANPVNCQGVSGAGLANEFARRYPKAQAEYEGYCRDGFLAPGWPLRIGRIWYFPTKDDWRLHSRLEWIQSGLRVIADTLGEHDSIAIPALGCGLGGLPWDAVSASVRVELEGTGADVRLYKPRG